MSEHENPQAFPVPPASFGPSGDLAVATEGMTLRDWFAGQALMGIIAGCAGSGLTYDDHEAAEDAFQVADAMLAARKAARP